MTEVNGVVLTATLELPTYVSRSKHVEIRILSVPFHAIPEENTNVFNPETGWYEALLYTVVNAGNVDVVESDVKLVVPALIEKFSAGTSTVPTVRVSPSIVPGKYPAAVSSEANSR